MQGIAHQQWLDRFNARQQRDFAPLYSCLKRCYPGLSDHRLSIIIGVDLTDFSRWKRKTRWPTKTCRRLVKVLCMMRIGAINTVYDLVYAGDVDLEKLVDEWEATQCAKSGQTTSKIDCPKPKST